MYNTVIKDEMNPTIGGFGFAMQGDQEIYVNIDELEKAQGIVQKVIGGHKGSRP